MSQLPGELPKRLFTQASFLRSRVAASVLLLAALLIAAPSIAERPKLDRLQHLDDRHGLSHTTVRDVIQDREGFFWLATQDGLNRYDGYDLKVYRHSSADPHTIPENEILKIFEDHQNRLWLTGWVSLSILDADREKFRALWPPPGMEPRPIEIRHIFENSANQIFLATDLGLFSESVKGELVEHPLDMGEVSWLAETEDSALWVAAEKGLYHMVDGVLELLPLTPSPSPPPEVYSLYEDSRGELWASSNVGLWRIPTGSRDPTLFYSTSSPSWIGAVTEDQNGALWVATSQGIERVGRDRESLDLMSCEGCQDDLFIVDLEVDSRNNVWAASSDQGVLRFDPETETLVAYRHDPEITGSISSNQALCLLEDRTGAMWICTHSGLEKFDPDRERFTIFDPATSRGQLSANTIWGIHEDREGILWVGTYDEGLNRVDRERGSTQHFRPDPADDASLSNASVTGIAEGPDGSIWIATEDGLNRLRPDLSGFDHFFHDPADPRTLSSSGLTSILFTRSGQLWLGTWAGLDRREEDGHFHRFLDQQFNTSGPDIREYLSLLEARDGTLWAPSGLYGVSLVDPVTENVRHLTTGAPDSISSNEVAAVAQDEEGRIWLGYYGAGLDRLEQEKVTHRYRVADGLPSDSVLGIVCDQQGFIWLSTYRGLSRFDPEAETFRNFDTFDGLPGNVYSSGSYHQSRRGEIFFGGVNGLTAFMPHEIELNAASPRVALTDFQLFYASASLKSQDPNSPLLQTISSTQRLELNHRQYVIGFEFAAFDVRQPARVRYRYRLDGFDQDWGYTHGEDRSAQYSNLDPGDYLLTVEAQSSDGQWSEHSANLEIHVLPPPWKTWWAYLLYGLTGICSIAGVFFHQQRKLENERALSSQLKEVDRLKDDLLANTSHELRTPIHGITGLAEALIAGSRGKVRHEIQGDLQMIVESGRRLTSLVDNILDFSKMKQSRLSIELRPTSLHALADGVLTLLRPLADTKRIELLNQIGPESPSVPADESRLQQVLINLVGNAIKFTDSGAVTLRATFSDDLVELKVKDSGIGIPAPELRRIFEAFAQVDGSAERIHGGTGLGLAISRQLVELHGGRIRARSQPGEGSTFIVSLPRNAESEIQHPLHEQAPSNSSHRQSARQTRESDATQPLSSGTLSLDSEPGLGEPLQSTGTETYHLLIVDDEPLIRQVMDSYLRTTPYRVTLVESGVQALEVLDETRTETAGEAAVDLVILDVMMPRLSGYDTCRRIRETWSSDALPVLFLTAKSQPEDLVAGFAAGGNDYLSKPISRQELLARLAIHLQLLAINRANLDQIKVLQGMLPICVHCKSIRDDEGFWNQLEDYLAHHSEAVLSHGLCPSCALELYPDMADD